MANIYAQNDSGTVRRHVFTIDTSGSTAPNVTWLGGEAAFVVDSEADLNGGELQLEYSWDDGATWGNIGAPVASQTAPAQALRIPPGLVRLDASIAPLAPVVAALVKILNSGNNT